MRRTLVLALALTACSHQLDGPDPTITGIDPGLVCNIVTTTLTITGDGLSPLAVDALTDDPALALPSITLQRISDLDGNPVTDPPIVLCPDPTDTSCTAVRWISQQEMQIDLDPSLMLAPGNYQVTVANANGKSFTATVTIEVIAPPEILSVIPTTLCAGGGDLIITGTGFLDGATASLGGQPLTISEITPTQITAFFEGGLPPGTYDLVVDNGAGCIDTLVDAVTIVPGPAVFYVDPPVVYDGVSVQATIYVSGVDAIPVSVDMVPDGQSSPVTDLAFSWDPLKPNRILATIPAGLATGAWDVRVSDGSCQDTLERGVTVTDTLTIAVDGITPPFGWTDDDTPVTVTATQPPPGGMVGFTATPRVYLNPDAAGPTTVASALAAVVYLDDGRLTAVVPAGLPADVYDLIVVNPDGTVGLLDRAFTVTPQSDPPPRIDSLSPASVTNQTGQRIDVNGANFRAPEVTAACIDDGGGSFDLTGTVNGSTATTIDVTFDMSALTSGGVCVVRVTNSDGTYADYSALAVTNPAQNLPATVGDDSLNVARRALAATAGRVTAQARYLYAIGGDDGGANLLASVETSPVDLFGRLDGWTTSPSSLPAGRSFATAVTIGRFIYLVGGRVGTAATDSVLRAQILDPRAAPSIDDLAFDYQPTGLEPGLYYYRVAAVMAANDPSNPGGETLASDPLPVIIPPVVANQVTLRLRWTAVAGAAGYRVYRTPTPDLLLDSARRIAEVSAAEFLDDGSAAIGTERPLPESALGTWHEVGPLGEAREGAGVTFAADPDDPGAYFLYAIGGRDAAGAASASYDVARIVVAADGSQTVSAFTGATLLGTARWQLSAVAMSNAEASVVAPGDTWIYAMGGLNGGGTMLVRDVTAAQVAADGTLTTSYEVDAMSPGDAGYGVAGANNFLYAFGGQVGGSPSAGNLAARMCAAGDAGCAGGMIPEPPDLVNWNALGFNLLQARYLPGSALESAFIFLVGGASATAPATATVERTHW